MKGLAIKVLRILKYAIENETTKLLMATNAGMYKRDNQPQGLYIENGKTITPLDLSKRGGNFYLKPNGVFFIKRASSFSCEE